MRNYKSTLEHFIALRRGERKSRYTGYTSCEEGGGVGIRRTEHFFTDRDKMGGGNAEWALVERTTLFIAKNSRHAPVRRKPAFWRIPGTLSGRKRKKKKPRFNGWNRALLFSSPFGRKYIYTAIRKEKTGFLVYENDLGLFFLDVNENFFLGGDDDFPNNNTGKNNIEFVPRFKGMKLGENKYLALVIYMEGRLWNDDKNIIVSR